MAIDLRKNKDALNKALETVVDTKQDVDWALFAYEGQTPILKVVGTGDGGIEEMADDLSSGKMMYGYCRVRDPNTGLPKFVLIHWTGEGVPENVKLKYTSHLRDVQNFLKSIHITIAARSEDDIDVDDIVKRVAKSSGANYNFHKEKAKPEESPSPVGTQYSRVIPTKEINISQRDKFWAQAEKEEIQRQSEERARSASQLQALEQERKDREEQEAKETKEREKKISEHMREVSKQRQAEKKADEENKDVEKQRWEGKSAQSQEPAQIQKESSIDEEERGHRSDQMRKQRAAEAAQLVSSGTSSARDFFKQKSVERPDAGPRAPPPPRKLQHSFGAQREEPYQPDAPRKQPIQLPKAEESAPAPSKPVRQPEPEPEPEPEPQYQYQAPEPEAQHEPTTPTTPTTPQTRDLLRQGLPPRQDSDEEEEDQDWEEPPAEEYTFREKRQPSFTEDYSAEQHHAETQSHRVSGTQHFVEEEQVPQEEEEEEQPAQETQAATEYTQDMLADQGQCARALYDYQAADDTEITFDPDDIITNIEQIDSGWWQGYGPGGSYGMFPANYVELIN